MAFSFYSNGTGTVSLSGYTGSDANVVIPSINGNGIAVTVIGVNSFKDKTGLTSVTIPASITSIGDSAFNGCSALTSVTIPNSVTSIGQVAFQGCSGLTSVTIPASVTSIGNGAFYGCSSLTNITIPASVTSIGPFAFYGCSALTSVTIPNSVASIGNNAFQGCSGLTSVTIPTSVTSIGVQAFYGCSALTNVTIPSSVTSIGDYAFYECTALTSVTIPAFVTSIGTYAFYGCSALTSVTLNTNNPTTITVGGYAFNSIGSNAVANVPRSDPWLAAPLNNGKWNGLTLVIPPAPSPFTFSTPSGGKVTVTGYTGTGTVIDIPSADAGNNTVTAIGYEAFKGKSGLTSVTIPAGVTSIGAYAFASCIGLTNVIIPNSVASIGDNAFRGCIGLTNVIIPNSVASIGEAAFAGCNSLTNVTIPNSVTSIGDYVFAGCIGLTSVTIPTSVTSIGTYAFYICTALTSVTIPAFVTSIGTYAFYGCSALTSVTIPASVTSIGRDVFKYSSITTINVPYGWNNGVAQEFETVFTDPDFATIPVTFGPAPAPALLPLTIKVNDITINYGSIYTPTYTPTGLQSGDVVSVTFTHNNSSQMPTSVGSYTITASAAQGTNLDKYQITYESGTLTVAAVPLPYTIVNGVLTAWPNASGAITIPNSVASIGDYAFARCTALTSVTIPNSVTSIGLAAFQGCTDLTNVTIPNSVASIGNNAFQGCSGLTSVTIPNSITSIGNFTFTRCSALTNVTIPNSVTSIGNSAFYECIGLTNVTISDGVTSIGYSAFLGCSALTNVTIPNSVTSISYAAFLRCTSLTSITLNTNNPTTITVGGDAFAGVSATSINVPRSAAWLEAPSSWNGLTLVIPPALATTITTTATSLTKTVGDSSFQIGATTNSDNPLRYSSSNSAVATVNSSGVVTIVGAGTATITITVLESVAFTSATATVSLTVQAAAPAPSPFTFSDPVDGKVSVTGYTGTDTVITIPASYNGIAVTVIGYEAFKGKSGLTSVTIPNSVTSIGVQAFYGCLDLTNITIPNSVTSIGSFAFRSSGLTSVTFAEGSLLTSIGDSAFYNCTALGNITIPEGVTSIGNSAFSGCSSLTSVSIPAGVTSIGNNAFELSSLTNVTIPASVTSIGNNAFWHMSNIGTLTSVTFNSVTPPYVGTAAFTSENAKAYVPRSAAWLAVTSPWNGLTLVIPSALATTITTTATSLTKTVGDSSFQIGATTNSDNPLRYSSSNSAVATVNSSGVVTIVGAGTATITITDPGSVAYVSATAAVVLTAAPAPSPFTFSDPVDGKVSVTGYTGTDTVITIPASYNGIAVTVIGYEAFKGKSGLTSVTIPNSVTSIGVQAFYGCLDLTNITIPNSVTSIGNEAFKSCSQLTSVIFAEGSQLQSISLAAFAGCIGLTNVIIPNSVTSIGDYAFNSCSQLTSVTLNTTNPAAITVGGDAFAHIGANAKVYVPRSAAWLAVTSSWNGLLVKYYGAPPQPTAVTATYAPNTITITWSGNSQLTYTVYDDTNTLQDTPTRIDNVYTLLILNPSFGTYHYYVIAMHNGVSSERKFSNYVSVISATATPATIVTPPSTSEVLSGSPLSTVVLSGVTTPVAGYFAFENPTQIVTASGSYLVIFYPIETNYSPSAAQSIPVVVINLTNAAAALSGAIDDAATAAAATTLITGFSDEAKEKLVEEAAGESIELNYDQIQNVLANAPYPAPGLDPASITQLEVIVPDANNTLEIPIVGNAYFPLVADETYFAVNASGPDVSAVTRKILYDGAGKLYIGPSTTTADRTPLYTSTATPYSAGATVLWTSRFTFKIPLLGGFATAEDNVPCFPAGTRLLTAAGYKAVETLLKSDRIVTADGRSVPFTLYSRVVDKTTAATAPYHIPAGTFGNKAITLSPLHAIQSSKGVWQIPYLAAKKFACIRQVNLGERVEYFHVELPNFFTDNIVAEGNVVESFAGKQTHGIKTIYTPNARLQGYTRISPAKKTLTA